MEAKEAVAAAKKHLVEIFEGEAIEPPTLEEIWFEAADRVLERHTRYPANAFR